MIIIYILAALIALFLIVAAVLPKSYNIQKAITIQVPASVAFEHVANLNHYRDWNPWQKMEPGAVNEITGVTATPGHKFSWKGKKIGVGSLTVKAVNPPKSINLDLEFIKPFASKANDNWTFEESNGATKVTWQNDGDLPYPMGRVMGAMIKKNLNEQFVIGLNNLKVVCEKKS
jgi:hypothetical protein